MEQDYNLTLSLSTVFCSVDDMNDNDKDINDNDNDKDDNFALSLLILLLQMKIMTIMKMTTLHSAYLFCACR
jgi:hypothetical protein